MPPRPLTVTGPDTYRSGDFVPKASYTISKARTTLGDGFPRIRPGDAGDDSCHAGAWRGVGPALETEDPESSHDLGRGARDPQDLVGSRRYE